MMSNPRPGANQGIAKDSSDLADEKQIVGKQIWRVIPYIKQYWQRAVGGIVANAIARAFDLIPFIAIGMAADYYASDGRVFPDARVVALLRADILPSVDVGFGLLILSPFSSLASSQGILE